MMMVSRLRHQAIDPAYAFPHPQWNALSELRNRFKVDGIIIENRAIEQTKVLTKIFERRDVSSHDHRIRGTVAATAHTVVYARYRNGWIVNANIV